MNTPPKPRALVDMDGTVADYDWALRRDMEALLSPDEELRCGHDDEDEYPFVKARARLIKSKPDWWYNLPVIDRGMRIVRMMNQTGFRITVLTRGPKPTPNAWTEKLRWVQTNMPTSTRTVITDDEKAIVYGRVLMDDYVPYIEPWLEARPRGIVILPDQPWNKRFKHPRVLRHTDNDLEVREWLIKARDRKRE